MSPNAFDPWPGWLATHVTNVKRADLIAEVGQTVTRHAQIWVSEFSQPRPVTSECAAAPYIRRVERCLSHHWERFAQGADQLPSVEHVLTRLERGDLGYDRPQTNVVREVILAQALEQHEARAAERFEEEFMPAIRKTAQRTAGQRGLELVENFTADLVLPRENRSPRIAGYLGKTSLASWLRVVATNHCRESGRHSEPVQSLGELEAYSSGDCDSDAEARGCEDLLRPIFVQAAAALESEDRLLIKLLVLEEIPQHTLAQRMGIHSGNVTRRRQRISETIWSRVHELRMSRCVVPTRVNECLELVLTGNDAELRRSLGQVLADAITLKEESR